MICLASNACVAKNMSKQRLFCFYILLTVHLNIFILILTNLMH